MSHIMLFLSMGICFAVLAAMQDLLGCYFTASPFFCVPPITELHHYVANSLTHLLPESTLVGQHSTSPNCVTN
jgi:hypothetical protein